MSDKDVTAKVEGIPDEIRRMVEHAGSLAVQIKLHNQVGLVEIQTRGKFDLRPHVTYLTYDTFEAIFSSILQLRLAAKGVSVELERRAVQ